MKRIAVEKMSFPSPSVNMREIMRYAGGGDEATIKSCLAEA